MDLFYEISFIFSLSDITAYFFSLIGKMDYINSQNTKDNFISNKNSDEFSSVL